MRVRYIEKVQQLDNCLLANEQFLLVLNFSFFIYLVPDEGVVTTHKLIINEAHTLSVKIKRVSYSSTVKQKKKLLKFKSKC